MIWSGRQGWKTPDSGRRERILELIRKKTSPVFMAKEGSLSFL
jgi:hypothetical protein